MGVKLDAIDTVVAGRFNPHIISPPWLAKEGIIAEGETVEAQIGVVGRAVVFRFKTGDFIWQVDYNRLVVSAEKIADTASVVAKVIEKLPHTPITAFGNNFHYSCNLSEWKGCLPRLENVGMDQLKEYGDVQSMGWKASISQADSVTVNVEMSIEPTESPPKVSVNLNYHRQVNAAADLVTAAQRFEEDRKASATLLESLLREKVEQ